MGAGVLTEKTGSFRSPRLQSPALLHRLSKVFECQCLHRGGNFCNKSADRAVCSIDVLFGERVLIAVARLATRSRHDADRTETQTRAARAIHRARCGARAQPRVLPRLEPAPDLVHLES